MNVTNYKIKRNFLLKVRLKFVMMFCTLLNQFKDFIWSGSVILVMIQIFRVSIDLNMYPSLEVKVHLCTKLTKSVAKLKLTSLI